jgi:hypothetical protein
MKLRDAFSVSAILLSASTAIAPWIASAAAGPQQLDCVLTDTDTQPSSQNRSVVVVFDEDEKSITAEQDGRSYSFTKVSISNVSISGHTDGISLGIDRSSLGIVWQQYSTDRVRTEYGHCHQSRVPK